MLDRAANAPEGRDAHLIGEAREDRAEDRREADAAARRFRRKTKYRSL